MPGLDGLRAVAVLAVILYHLNFGWASGGMLGVGVFLVLSGYLITDLLLAERERNGTIALAQFWLRRARRLLPALWVMLCAVTLWITFLDPSQLAPLRGDLLAALLYISNWWYAFQHVSYFASFGSPAPLGHLWSLAVEEQFYLVWPLLLIAALRLVRRRELLIGIVCLGAIASAVAMATMFQPGSDPTRVYEGTDTRAFQLLIGAALALAWPSRRLTGPVTRLRRLGLDALGAAGMAVIIVLVMTTNEYEPFLYRGGMLLLSLATLAVVAALAHPATLGGRILGVRPLRWIGVRSYGIYLWHYPIIVLSNPDVGAPGPLRTALQVGATVVIAGLSWRFLEEPIRRGGLRGAISGLMPPRWAVRGVSARLWATLGAAGLVLGASAAGLAGVIPETRTAEVVALPPSLVVAPGRASTSPAPLIPAPPCTAPSRRPSPAETPTPEPSPSPSPAVPPEALATTVVGDSIIIDVGPYLHSLLPAAYIDGKVSRQMSELSSILAQLHASGELYPRLVIELGTNGPGWDPNQVASLLRSQDLERIVLVNSGMDPAHPDWASIINQQLDEVASQVPGATVVDWYGASIGHPEYFMWGSAPGDGVHPGPGGSQVMATLIARAVESGAPGQASETYLQAPTVRLLRCTD